MKQERILITSLARHDDFNTSTTFQLAKRFSIDHEVLIVEHPFTWFDLVKGIKDKKGKKRLRATLSSELVLAQKDGLEVLIPPATIPINFLPKGGLYRFFQRINERILAKSINRFLKEKGWESYFFVNSYHYHFPRVDALFTGKIKRSLYHCVDPIVKPYTRKHGLENEKMAVLQADAVVSTAPALVKKWKRYSKSFLVPNAVDFAHFDRPHQSVDRIRNLGTKIIGYFGNIERRIDYSLLIETFEKHPDWQLVLAGKVERKYVPKNIYSLPNIHFIDAYTYEELPHMLSAVDVLLIPFKCDEAARAIYPLKLFEYMSIGKPVVSTTFNEEVLHELKAEIYLSNETVSLEREITRALEEDNEFVRKRRKEIASQNTWDHRAAAFLKILKYHHHDTNAKANVKRISGSQSEEETTVFATAV